MPPSTDGRGRPARTATTQSDASIIEPIDRVWQYLPAYALVVRTPKGRHRRRLFMTLCAAEAAVQRAAEAGQPATIVLVAISTANGSKFVGGDRDD